MFDGEIRQWHFGVPRILHANMEGLIQVKWMKFLTEKNGLKFYVDGFKQPDSNT